MRRIGLTDLDLAARHLMELPREERVLKAEQMLYAAHRADIVRKRLKRVVLGRDGSLAGEALHRGVAPCLRNEPEYLHALGVVAQAAVYWAERAGG